MLHRAPSAPTRSNTMTNLLTKTVCLDKPLRFPTLSPQWTPKRHSPSPRSLFVESSFQITTDTQKQYLSIHTSMHAYTIPRVTPITTRNNPARRAPFPSRNRRVCEIKKRAAINTSRMKSPIFLFLTQIGTRKRPARRVHTSHMAAGGTIVILLSIAGWGGDRWAMSERELEGLVR